MSNTKREELADTGRGTVGKTAVVGAKDRETNQVSLKVIECTNSEPVHVLVSDHADDEAIVVTDKHKGYHSIFHHLSAKHLQRYVYEFATCHNLRLRDTAEMMSATVTRMEASD